MTLGSSLPEADAAPQGDYVHCPLCEREVLAGDFTSKHHLVPKSRHGRVTLPICKDCHGQIHVLFDNKTLERELNTVEALKANEKFQTWINWISKRNSAGRLRRRQSSRKT